MCAFDCMPIELVELWLQYLELSDIASFRLVCRKAESQAFETFCQYFSTVETYLMGKSLARLESISNHPNFSKYVKEIIIQDKVQSVQSLLPEKGKSAPSLWPVGQFWPRTEEGLLRTDGIGCHSLKAMLQSRRLRLKKITIRDYCPKGRRNPGPGSIGDLTREILAGSNVAVMAINFDVEPPYLYKATVNLGTSRKNQTYGLSSALLSIGLIQRANKPSSWTEQALYHSPNLKHLRIRSLHNSKDCALSNFTNMLSTGHPVFQLESLTLCGPSINPESLYCLLANSKQSLTYLRLMAVNMSSLPEWVETLSRLASELSGLTFFKLFLRIGTPNVPRAINFQLWEHNVPEKYRGGLALKELGTGRGGNTRLVTYEGPYACEMLRIVADTVVHQSA